VAFNPAGNDFVHPLLAWIGLDDLDDSIHRLLQSLSAMAHILNPEYAP